jgi:hypothetical protein
VNGHVGHDTIIALAVWEHVQPTKGRESVKVPGEVVGHAAVP